MQFSSKWWLDDLHIWWALLKWHSRANTVAESTDLWLFCFSTIIHHVMTQMFHACIFGNFFCFKYQFPSLYPPPLFFCLEFQIIWFVISTFTPIYLKFPLFYPPPLVLRTLEWWDAVLQKRLAWALFVLLLSTLVCCQPTELIWVFLFHKFSNFTPPPQADNHMALIQKIETSKPDWPDCPEDCLELMKVCWRCGVYFPVSLEAEPCGANQFRRVVYASFPEPAKQGA